MKTAEEIIKINFYPYSGWRSGWRYDHEELVKIVEQIQKESELAGWKRGMTEAAQLGFENLSVPDYRNAILSKRDEKGGE